MAEETITIVKVGTDEAVKSINDLKNNIKILKDNLGDLEVGTEEYQNTLDELKVNQNALKDAMYATSSSMEDVAKAATGASESYNSLVHRMASLKEEFRATNDEVRRAELGKQIKEVNDQLKDLDALQGNFQRNVGNYAGDIKKAFGDMSINVDVFRKSLGAVGGGLNGMKDGLEGIAKSPAVATFGLLVSVALKLVDSLKDNETAMAALKTAMAALQPVMDFFSNILDKVADFLADIITEMNRSGIHQGHRQCSEGIRAGDEIRCRLQGELQSRAGCCRYLHRRGEVQEEGSQGGRQEPGQGGEGRIPLRTRQDGG